MGLPEDLLRLARRLVNNKAKELREVRMRRAVSTAYYALFHLLVEAASERIVTDINLRGLVGRAFAHAQMQKVAKSFRSGEGSLPRQVVDAFSGTIPSEIQRIADVFLDLQQARHDADYDRLKDVTRARAQDLVTQAEQAFADWNTVLGSPAASTAVELFLASLLLWERWQK